MINKHIIENGSNNNKAVQVNNTYKFTLNDEEMMPSLLTLNNIIGSSEIKTNNLNEKKLLILK